MNTSLEYKSPDTNKIIKVHFEVCSMELLSGEDLTLILTVPVYPSGGKLTITCSQTPATLLIRVNINANNVTFSIVG